MEGNSHGLSERPRLFEQHTQPPFAPRVESIRCVRVCVCVRVCWGGSHTHRILKLCRTNTPTFSARASRTLLEAWPSPATYGRGGTAVLSVGADDNRADDNRGCWPARRNDPHTRAMDRGNPALLQQQFQPAAVGPPAQRILPPLLPLRPPHRRPDAATAPVALDRRNRQ